MVAPVLNVIKDWTGVEAVGCPWFAFFDPFVSRVLAAYSYYDKGQLAMYAPEPSHRLVEGVGFYGRMLAVVRDKKWEKEREQRDREARQRAQPKGTVRVGRG